MRAIERTPSGDDAARIAALRRRLQSISDPFQVACYRALLVTMEAIFTKQGRIVNDPELIVSVALRLVGNDYGSCVLQSKNHLTDKAFTVVRIDFRQQPATTKGEALCSILASSHVLSPPRACSSSAVRLQHHSRSVARV
jgi:hypothetical protein